MFEIDKQKLGILIAQLRKEKGLTQKELAQKLFLSDKAISKWETGASMPDISLLIPLSTLLDVSVTELLTGRRMQENVPIDTDEVEKAMKTAISYTAQQQEKETTQKQAWTLRFVMALFLSCGQIFLLYQGGHLAQTAVTVALIGAIMGGYFCLFAKTRLPAYYDENKISVFHDGIFKMHMTGLHFNNSNWPHILNVGRIWAILMMIGYPVLCYIMQRVFFAQWSKIELAFCLIVSLGSLFVPMYLVGKRFE